MAVGDITYLAFLFSESLENAGRLWDTWKAGPGVIHTCSLKWPAGCMALYGIR